MAKFGTKSNKIKKGLSLDLQLICNEAIKIIDFSLLEGHRTPERQFDLFKIGRELKDGKWIVVGKVVTKIDGKRKKGKHNLYPSKAVDVIMYHKDKPHYHWNNEYEFGVLAGVFMTVADRLKKEGKICCNLRFGSDWDGDSFFLSDQKFNDMPHIEEK